MENINLFESPQVKHIHFVGIGGSSMSGLAEILISLGYKISGSDMKESASTQKLGKMGAQIRPYHSAESIENPDLVVYTVAVKDNNPELIKAREMGIPVIDRAALLGQLMKKYPFSIAISGTHGKTTTTSMVTMIMLESGLDPTIHIGGELPTIGGNTKIGGNQYFITEACEYYGSFLKFNPYLAVILNIELDHVDYFKDIDHIKDTFYMFAKLVPDNGYVVACIDDANTSELINRLSCKKITYGVKSPDAEWTATGIEYDEKGCASFKLVKDGSELDIIRLSVPGIHNVSNSLAAIASCYALGCDLKSIKEGLLKFTGTLRRFELKGIADNIRVVDDYAHHPSEVVATLKAAKNGNYDKVWCVFQPHTYTRTKSLLGDFSKAFSNADRVIVSDIYAAREIDTGEIHSSMVADKIASAGQNAVYISGFDAIADYLDKNVSPGDLVITMGAGDIYKVGELFLRKRNQIP
ncbi:MAG: UDP-N-acetylmuramate--L-alanine ligase [Clostridia bacterium]|nr:UDP-N-acetylmuramate--L-alanine ligase [Clostridia bacterium]